MRLGCGISSRHHFHSFWRLGADLPLLGKRELFSAFLLVSSSELRILVSSVVSTSVWTLFLLIGYFVHTGRTAPGRFQLILPNDFHPSHSLYIQGYRCRLDEIQPNHSALSKRKRERSENNVLQFIFAYPTFWSRTGSFSALNFLASILITYRSVTTRTRRADLLNLLNFWKRSDPYLILI